MSVPTRPRLHTFSGGQWCANGLAPIACSTVGRKTRRPSPISSKRTAL
ncbi:hypothetical protein COLINT_03054 [Collinsella intestinalis DSM 13280]|uniref:Uncharacterized protein n=1 Tax=Collinsella intestinalis DSM 13280 TaxID=521003 RepID=C4FAG2_9ACTN|nr:hypothetical protein COLINT_03054 [Collinsella intestinalis DSM 13280]